MYIRYLNRIRDKSNGRVVVPDKPKHKLNNKFTLPFVFQEEHVSHVTPMSDIIPITLLNKEDIEEVNDDDSNVGSEEEEYDDDYKDIDDEIDVHLKYSKYDNETKDGD